MLLVALICVVCTLPCYSQESYRFFKKVRAIDLRYIDNLLILHPDHSFTLYENGYATKNELVNQSVLNREQYTGTFSREGDTLRLLQTDPERRIDFLVRTHVLLETKQRYLGLKKMKWKRVDSR